MTNILMLTAESAASLGKALHATIHDLQEHRIADFCNLGR